jgi:xanthine dehydrogenase accessory factor
LATLVSVDGDYSRGEESKVLVRPTGEKVGSLLGWKETERRILGEGQALFKEKRPKLIVLEAEKKDLSWLRMEVLLEPVLSEPTVYVFGAGHVSLEIAPLAKRVQFKVVVIDDREMFANRERFPDADEIFVSEFERCFDRLSLDETSFVVIVTRGHLYDGFVLEQAVKTPARYIGMIGSRKKIHILYQHLMEKGIPKETLKRVHAPIGLEIHSETPEEIAVSIVAQLIQVRGEPL